MRQAGRYLPEYREACVPEGPEVSSISALTPAWAAEATLQPLRRFDLDAAIIFADILLIPYALGRSLDFREGEGPVLEALQGEADIAKFSYDVKKLEPVFGNAAAA